MFKRALLAASALGLSTAAGAVTFDASLQGFAAGFAAPAGGIYYEDFDSGTAANFSGGAVVNTTVIDQYAAPKGDTTPYFSTGPSTSSPATFNILAAGLSGLVGSVSFYWGSIDGYNSITFEGLGVTFTGDDIVAPATGSQTLDSHNRRVTFNFTAAEAAALTGITFVSKDNGVANGNAFEFDNFSIGAVPEPAAWMTMIAGFGLVGGAMRRRRVNVAYA